MPTILLLSTLLAFPAPRPAGPRGRAPAILQARGIRRNAGTEIILDAAAWADFWERLDQPAPALDFSTQCAVAVFAGPMKTGGHSVQFLDTRARGKDLVVRWRLRTPPPAGVSTQVLSWPWAWKAFPRPQGRILLEAAPPAPAEEEDGDGQAPDGAAAIREGGGLHGGRPRVEAGGR